LNVTDNGHGFNPESPSEQDSEHLGLLGMRERSRRLDGRLEVHSVLGRGTEVVATIPLNK
jgi:signal transduction histidine kinase